MHIPPGAPSGHSAARARRGGSSNGQRTLRVILAFAAVALLLLGAVVVYGLQKFNSIERVKADVDAVVAEQPRNFLLVGSDTRDIDDTDENSAAIFGNETERPPGGQRADTILIARVDPMKSTIELLSIPRDLWVKTPNGKRGRINAAYNNGPQLLIDTIRQNLGISINHYVEVNFNGFKGLVDAIGGVPLYFSNPVRDRNSGLRVDEPGCHVLEGSQALAFARSRHLEVFNGKSWKEDGAADLGRITRQQIFLRHSLGKVSTLGIDDVGTLRSLIGVAIESVKLDDSLGTSDIIDLARKFSDFNAKAMVVHRLPTEPFRTGGGADVLRIDQTAGEQILDIFRGKRPATKVELPPTTVLSAANLTVSVHNAAGQQGLARSAADLLATHGFRIGEVGNSDRQTKTTLRFAPGAEAQASLVAAAISPSPTLAPDPSIASGTVTLVLGSDGATISQGTAVVPGVASNTGATGAGSGVGSTTVPAEGQATPEVNNGVPEGESQAGIAIGDPPKGVSCG